jgi:hypothetical protein
MDITDALDAYLTAKMKIAEWQSEFMGSFYKPVGEMIIGLAKKSAQAPSQQMMEPDMFPMEQQEIEVNDGSLRR